MTGREKILGAFDPSGTPRFGVVSAYENLFVRDHWASLAASPWLEGRAGAVDKEVAWTRQVAERTGLEWITVTPSPPRSERSHRLYEQRADDLWLIEEGRGGESRVAAPAPSGMDTVHALSLIHI